MPYSWNRPPVPIDKSKQGGRSFDSSTYTDFTKIGTIAQVNATKSTGTNNKNLYSNLDEKRRAELLISGLQTIPRALCPTCPNANISFAQQTLNSTPPGTVTLTLMTYYPPGSSSAFPGILTTSANYGINWYYVYLDCNATWFGNAGVPSNIWCSAPNTNQIYENATQAAWSFVFSGATTFTTNFPTGINNFWIVSDTGRSYYTTPTTTTVNGSNSIVVQQVDYVTNSGTAARPDTRAGGFIRNAFLTGSPYVWNNLKTVTLPIPAFYV